LKIAVYQGHQKFSIEDVPVPSPSRGQLLVKVKYSAICGTDVHGFLYDVVPPGTVMGHEYSGVIVEIGEGVTKWSVGDRVVAGGVPPQGKEARYISNPRFNYRELGYAISHRGYAEYLVMEDWEPTKIPDGVSDEAAALAEPSGVAVRAVRKSELRLGDTVGVIGAGPIGLFTIQVAKAAGASDVYVSEPVPARREAALNAGASGVYDPSDMIESVVAATEGLGPHVVFECVGIGRTLDQSLDMVRQFGQVVLVGVAWEETPVLPANWMAREVKLQTTFGARPSDYGMALKLIDDGRIEIDHMVSNADVIPLDGIQRAFEDLVNPSTQVQVLIKPDS